jgi:serine/threonine protein kinase
MSDPARRDAPAPPNRSQPGTLVGTRFRVKHGISQQRGVELLRASDAQSGEDVALLVVRPEGPARALLERELAKAQRLPAHKNLAAVIAAFSDGRELIVAQEWLDGHSLREIVDAHRSRRETVGAERAYTILGHVAAALDHGYAQLVHGGVNPGNIWVTSGGRVKIGALGLTLGLPALARGGGPEGAHEGIYLAPEVAAGGEPTPAADVYSLGAILFELLAGVPPTPPLVPPSRLQADVSPALDAVVGRALLPNPAGRYTHPAEFVRGLGAAMAAAAAPPGATPATMTPGSAPAAASASPSPAVAGESNPSTTSGVRAFDVAAAAGLSHEDARWLVQKDKLDFGPFSLQQIKSHLEKGTFRSADLIVDMDSGARQKIIEHPQLSDFARNAERHLEHARRLKAEHAHEHVERKKSRAMLFVIGAAVLLLAVGGGFWIMNREAAKESTLASRVGEADVDDFLKAVKLDFPTTKRPTARRVGRGATGAKGDDPFDGVQNLGDVSQGGSEEILSDSAIQGVMMGNYRKLVPCIMDERRRSPGLSEMDLEFLVTGAGKVAAVKVNGQQKGAFPSCVLARMGSFPFPKYNGSKTIASWSMSLR